MFCFYLTPTSRNPETPDKSWYAETRGSLRCGGCGKFQGRQALPDVKIQGRGLSDKSDLNFVVGVICFAKRRFLNEVIPEELRFSFYFGKLIDSQGVECTEVATYMA